MGIAQAKGQLGGFNDAVNGVRVVGLRHIQAVGDAEYRQRDQPLRRRGVVKDLSLLMLQLQRRGATGNVRVKIGQRHGQAQRLHAVRQHVRQRAAIKAVQTVLCQARQG